MEKEYFVNKLKSLAPSKDEFKKYNVSNDYIENYIGHYCCLPRVNTQFGLTSNNLILNLLLHYDCSKVEIGNLSLAGEIIEYKDYCQIGKVELDILALNKITMEIEVRDHDARDYVIWPCAANSDSFLDALLLCAEYLYSIFKNPSLGDDNNYSLKFIEACTEKSGGEKYADFYKMLLGYFE